MKIAILITSVLALGVATQVSAEPSNNRGHGQSHPHNSTMKHGGERPNVAADRANNSGIIRSDRNGRLYALDGRGNCPPGLAKKNNGCTPPGQAKKEFDVGQRYNTNFGNIWGFNQIPNNLRTQYNLDASDRYYYSQGYLYRVDQQSNLIEQVISILLR